MTTNVSDLRSRSLTGVVLVDEFGVVISGGALGTVGISAGTALIGKVISVGSTATDRSGTITLGGTAQNAMTANTSRNTWTFINSSDTLMNVSASGTATATAGIPLYPNDMASGNETNAISVYCATTGKAFTAWEN